MTAMRLPSDRRLRPRAAGRWRGGIFQYAAVDEAPAAGDTTLETSRVRKARVAELRAPKARFLKMSEGSAPQAPRPCLFLRDMPCVVE